MSSQKSNDIFSMRNPSGVLFVGSILIGTALGMLRHDVGPYSVLGAGVGFVLAAFLTAGRSSKK